MSDVQTDDRLDQDDLVEFVEEDDIGETLSGDPWKVLVVDDDEDVHKMTQYVLKSFTMEGRPLEILSANSGVEGKHVLTSTNDIALILLDVVMESDDAGLQFVKYVRDELQDKCIQIVLRTGQPGLTCELDAIMQYEINDYKTKTELSSEKLFTTVASSLRSYKLASSYRDAMARLEEELRLRTKAEAELEESKRLVEERVWARTQELLEAKEKAEYSLRNRSEFVANVAHEIRTPLNAVLSTARLLESVELSKEAKDYVGMLSDSAQYLLAMVNDIMDFSKIEEGKMTLSEEHFDLKEMVEGIGKLLQPVAAEKGLDFHVEFSQELPQNVHADANRLRQVIMNLAGNGIKFTNEGHVRIKVSVEEDDLKPSLVIRVTDTGVGIAADKRETIFERFAQTADGERKANSSGLGLFITKHLVELMEGSINVLSVEGSGSSFVVRLPIQQELQQAMGLKHFPGRNKRVLLAITDPVAKGILKKRLLVWGFEIIESLSSEENLSTLSFAIVDPAHMANLKKSPGQEFLDHLSGVVLLKRTDQLLDTEFSSHPKVKQLNLPLQTPAIAEVIGEVTGDRSFLEESEMPAVDESIWPQFGLDVLVADDESVNRTVIRIMLEKLGCTVVCVENGQEAVDAFGDKEFDIIFLDHRMPIMNGIDAAVEMKKSRLSDCPPIYALTGDDLPTHAKRFFAAGMKGVVSKPIDWEQLMEALERAKV